MQKENESEEEMLWLNYEPFYGVLFPTVGLLLCSYSVNMLFEALVRLYIMRRTSKKNKYTQQKDQSYTNNSQPISLLSQLLAFYSRLN